MLRFFRILFLVLAFFCIKCFASGICVNASITPTLNADYAFRVPKMAFSDNNFHDFKLFSANTNIEFSRLIQKMKPKNCSVILGLITSRECLIAGPSLKKHNVIGMSPCCGYDRINKFYPNIYVGSAPLSKEVGVIVKYLKDQSSNRKVFVIYKPTNIYSADMFDQFKKQFRRKFVDVRVATDDKFNIGKFLYIKNQKVNFVFLTYPLSSVKVLLELSKHNLITRSVSVIGGSSWGDEVALLKSIKKLLSKAKEALCVEMVNWDKIKHSSFVKRFRRNYGRNPLDIEVLSYDLTSFAIKCYIKASVGGKYNIRSFQHCLSHDRYNGVSGAFLFNKGSSFADRPIYLVNLINRVKD